jgi:hypothetical protein
MWPSIAISIWVKKLVVAGIHEIREIYKYRLNFDFQNLGEQKRNHDKSIDRLDLPFSFFDNQRKQEMGRGKSKQENKNSTTPQNIVATRLSLHRRHHRTSISRAGGGAPLGE